MKWIPDIVIGVALILLVWWLLKPKPNTQERRIQEGLRAANSGLSAHPLNKSGR